MKPNRSFAIAAICLALVPLALAGMFWSVWKQSSQAQPPIAAPAIEQRFSLEDSLNRLSQIDQALTSFRRLTEKNKAKLGEAATAEVGNTDWETQNLGFPNWVSSLEGTLKKQNYQIKQLEFELAKKQFEDRQISQTTLDRQAADLKKAEREFQDFLKTFKIAD